MLSWSALFLLVATAALVWFWQDSLAARERANAAAIEACENLGLQFLDGTVAFARIGWSRRASGRLVLRRTYVFDYTATSIERLQGFVILSGHLVESVGYARHEPARPSPSPPPPTLEPPPPPTDRPSNVLDLSEWRSRQRPPSPVSREPREDRGDQRH